MRERGGKFLTILKNILVVRPLCFCKRHITPKSMKTYGNTSGMVIRFLAMERLEAGVSVLHLDTT